MATTRITIPQEWRQEERDLQVVIPKAIISFHSLLFKRHSKSAKFVEMSACIWQNTPCLI